MFGLRLFTGWELWLVASLHGVSKRRKRNLFVLVGEQLFRRSKGPGCVTTRPLIHQQPDVLPGARTCLAIILMWTTGAACCQYLIQSFVFGGCHQAAQTSFKFQPTAYLRFLVQSLHPIRTQQLDAAGTRRCLSATRPRHCWAFAFKIASRTLTSRGLSRSFAAAGNRHGFPR